MHVPDGFLDLPTSVATGAVAVAGVGLAVAALVALDGDAISGVRALTAAVVASCDQATFDELLNYARGKYASGEGLR